MRLLIVAVGEKMPSWINEGWAEYAKRMPRECSLQLVEIPAAKHGKGGSVQKAVIDESKRMLAALPARCHVVAMDERGAQRSTLALADSLKNWLASGDDVAFLIGGADGLAPECKERSHAQWSLSPLTLPHGLVRVILAEQLYRAHSVLRGHPYHRGG
jgi:23S rRNA (pseudouridine1915-N3)-methyltransferase